MVEFTAVNANMSGPFDSGLASKADPKPQTSDDVKAEPPVQTAPGSPITSEAVNIGSITLEKDGDEDAEGLIDPFTNSNVMVLTTESSSEDIEHSIEQTVEESIEVAAPVSNNNNVQPDDDIDDEQLGALGHLGLNRHIYQVYGEGVETGEKITGRVNIESEGDPYWNWPLYNDFKGISKEDTDSWPPAFVNLQDWHVRQVLKADVPKRQCHARWPADFNAHGEVHKKRKPKGRAAKVKHDGDWHYAVVSGTYQLSGDEAGQAVITIPPNVDAPTDHSHNTIGIGQFCEVQDVFHPTLAELSNGMFLSRLHDSVVGLRPLNNRDNWGPENRTGPQPGMSKTARKRAKKAKAIVAEDADDAEHVEENDEPVPQVQTPEPSLKRAAPHPPAQVSTPQQPKKVKIDSEAEPLHEHKSSPSISGNKHVDKHVDKNLEIIRACAKNLLTADGHIVKNMLYEKILLACDEIQTTEEDLAG